MFRISKIPIIESNSQLKLKINPDNICCFVYQRYQLLKAIHNLLRGRNRIWWLFRISKIPIIESNSQLFLCELQLIAGCFVYQRYQLLKAIHNTIKKTINMYWLFRISKIPIIESNSQRSAYVNPNTIGCFVYQRYQLLKAIHNACDGVDGVSELFRISKIPIIESYSQ